MQPLQQLLRLLVALWLCLGLLPWSDLGALIASGPLDCDTHGRACTCRAGCNRHKHDAPAAEGKKPAVPACHRPVNEKQLETEEPRGETPKWARCGPEGGSEALTPQAERNLPCADEPALAVPAPQRSVRLARNKSAGALAPTPPSPPPKHLTFLFL